MTEDPSFARKTSEPVKSDHNRSMSPRIIPKKRDTSRTNTITSLVANDSPTITSLGSALSSTGAIAHSPSNFSRPLDTPSNRSRLATTSSSTNFQHIVNDTEIVGFPPPMGCDYDDMDFMNAEINPQIE